MKNKYGITEHHGIANLFQIWSSLNMAWQWLLRIRKMSQILLTTRDICHLWPS